MTRLHGWVAILAAVPIAVGMAPRVAAQTYEASGPPAGVAASGQDLEAVLAVEGDAELPDWMLSSGTWLANGIPDPEAKRLEPEPKRERTKPKPKLSRVQIVLKTAKAQLGKPYRWASTGPNSFDCSGFVTFVYRAIGVSMPRTSRGMYAALPRVKKADLRPGDLVFSGWGSVGHVGIYVGDGKMIHSPQTGERVKVSPLRSNYIGAGRPGR